MLTKTEMECMEAVRVMAREIVRKMYNGPDWEQRRYEIARELLPTLVQAKHNGTGINNLTDVYDMIDTAVSGANLLILKLRKAPIPE